MKKEFKRTEVSVKEKNGKIKIKYRKITLDELISFWDLVFVTDL